MESLEMDSPLKNFKSLSPVISKFATVLSLVEVGLGSLLHSFRIPLTGQLLSLNQGFLLTRATIESKLPSAAQSISIIAAMLKSLSPAGKKLTPMLAISAQGVLFSLGPVLLGINWFGLIVGMTLLCLWAFLQPLLIYLILYGKTLLDVAQYFFDQLQSIIVIQKETLLWILLSFVVLKIIVGIAVVILAVKIPDAKLQNYITRLEVLGREKLEKRNAQTTGSSPFRLALRDLFNPLFIVSLTLTAVFFFVTDQETTTIIWGLMRPLGIGFLLFYLVRLKKDSNLPFIKFFEICTKRKE